MSASDITALLPIITPAIASVLVMMVIAFRRNHALTAALTTGGLVIASSMLLVMLPLLPRQVTPLIFVDRYAFFFMGLFFAASFFVVLLSYGYFAARPGRHDEFYVLLLIATFGSAVLAASSHFVSFFLGLELLGISLYSMIAYQRTDRYGNEAGIKYLVLAATSSAFLLFGMALVYAQLGTMQFTRIAVEAAALSVSSSLPLLAGFALIIVGIGFKLALVPFHMWSPDVYEGAPAPVSAFIATVSKGAVFVLLLRYFSLVDIHRFPAIVTVFTIIAIASMLIGNLLALAQNNIKRILAYSSIAHLGYVLVAFIAGGPAAITAASYYLAAYFVTILGAFGIISVLSSAGSGGRDADALDEYRGMAWHRPWLAGMLTLVLFSLAGIPLTAGFMGKFLVISAGAGSTLWLLLVVVAVSSSIGLYYYLRIITVLYTRVPAQVPEKRETPAAGPRLSLSGGTALVVLAVLLIWLGVFPSPLLRLIKATAEHLIY
ncbi:MAG: NADH-quinone oxidoreductase subunit N [Nitrospirae bacterium]|nr:NADH-quinone oxidoreductase subunit N [Nitrospirota bacterium]